MRKFFSETLELLIKEDPAVVTLLGDIGVFSFRKTMEAFPERVINLGILEQSMVGIAAGLSKQGLIPFVHTIAPFLVERAYEQLKIDFGYQRLRGNFVSVGASSDYSTLGCTHHCPNDISLLKAIPGFEIFVPGNPEELVGAIKSCYGNEYATYYRLSELSNTNSYSNPGHLGTVVKKGSRCTVIVFGPILDITLEGVAGLDVEVIYLYKVQPIDEDIIKSNCRSRKILIIEPFLADTMLASISNIFSVPMQIKSLGYPLKFIRNYGTLKEHLEFIGLDRDNIRNRVLDLIYKE